MAGWAVSDACRDDTSGSELTLEGGRQGASADILSPNVLPIKSLNKRTPISNITLT